MGATLRVQFSKNKLASGPASSKKTNEKLEMDDPSIPDPADTFLSSYRTDADRLTDIDTFDSSIIHSFHTPALETLMHLDRLARIRLERKYLERYYSRSSSDVVNTFSDSST